MKKLLFIPMLFAFYMVMGQFQTNPNEIIRSQKRQLQEIMQKEIQKTKKVNDSIKLKKKIDDAKRAKFGIKTIEDIGYSTYVTFSFNYALSDLPKALNWYDAKAACALLGDGWRLPTIKELTDLNFRLKGKKYTNNNINGITGDILDGVYWTDNGEAGDNEVAKKFVSIDYEQIGSDRSRANERERGSSGPKSQSKNLEFKVRAVKSK